MAGWVPYLKSGLVTVDLSFWTLTALTVDRESSHFLAQHTITHLCFSQRRLSLFPPRSAILTLCCDPCRKQPNGWTSWTFLSAEFIVCTFKCICKISHCFIKQTSGSQPRYSLGLEEFQSGSVMMKSRIYGISRRLYEPSCLVDPW